MDISGEYTFDAPQDMVWEALNDPNVLGAIMPGGQGVEQTGEDEYAGTLKIKVGPVQGVFKGSIKLSDINPPVSYRLDVDGKGPAGFMRGQGGMELSPVGEEKTHMRYEGSAQVGGRIATVGQRLVESSARSILDQSLNSLNEYLKARVAGDDGGTDIAAPASGKPAAETEAEPATDAPGEGATATTEREVPRSERATAPLRKPEGMSGERPAPTPPPYKPPSMTSVAVNVAKDVTEDLIPPHYRPVAIAVGAFFLGILTARFSRR